jgi:sulfatase modifying factor 1
MQRGKLRHAWYLAVPATACSCGRSSLDVGEAPPVDADGVDGSVSVDAPETDDSAQDIQASAAPDVGSPEAEASIACPASLAHCAPGGPGLNDCGALGESCCTSPEVTGGTFYRTFTNAGDGGTGEADPTTVSTFRLDRYEVTVGRFRQFVAAWCGGSG